MHVTIKPMPEPPPVMRATLPLTLKTWLSWNSLFDMMECLFLKYKKDVRGRGRVSIGTFQVSIQVLTIECRKVVELRVTRW
jgi:hypothetical protein